MTQAPQDSQVQDNLGTSEQDTRRAKCLTGFLSHGLVKIMRRSIPTERAFFCRSDLNKLWGEKPSPSEPRPLDTVLYHLSEGQRELILEKLVLFISFLVFVGASPDWFTTSGTRVLGQDWRQSKQLMFEDEDGPMSEERLRELGLTPTQAAHWEEQYMFRPASIRFGPDEWRQEIDSMEPLPFEKVDRDDAMSSLVQVDDSDSTGYYSEYGTVQLYRIPEECVVIVRSEEWMPKTSPLRIVKSFLASMPALEEAKNMDFLKGSLTKNHSIAIHDAIIERRKEDHTRISIILPYASLGDLSQFLVDGVSEVAGDSTNFYDFREKFPHVASGYELDRSLLRQLGQLTDALRFLHEGFRTVADDWKVNCAHMDLKPANIIIFESSDGIVGKWKLCDFGISVFYAEQKGQRGNVVSIGDYFNKVIKTTQRSPRRPPGAFQAPEVEFPSQFEREGVDEDPRSSDIWSFGAIFAEVLAYASGRSTSVKKFRQRRTQRTSGRPAPDDFFYTWIPSESTHHASNFTCILRSEVSQWLDEFDVDGNEDQPPSTCTVCLKCWATCVKSILEVNPEDRPDVATLDQWMMSLQKHISKSGKTSCISTFPRRLHSENIRDFDSSTSATYDRTWSPSLYPVESVTSSSSGNIPQRQERSNSSTPSGIPGSPRRVSNAQSSQVLKFDPTLSSEVIDYDIDGDRVAYLGGNDFQVFRLLARNHAMTFQPGNPVPLAGREQKWKGISLSGDYLVVWGTVSNIPVLRVYDVLKDPVPLQPTDNLPNFDIRKRVAVSKSGYIAIINNNLIYILRARDQTVYRRLEMPVHGRISKFLGIAFDETGSTLYAWGNQDIYGSLFAYDVTNEASSEKPMFQGKYQDDFNGQDVDIMPLQGQADCVIAVGPRYFMGCVDPGRRQHMLRRSSTQARQSLLDRELTPQHVFGPSKGPETFATCVFDDTLILVQNTRSGRFSSSRHGTGQLCQQPLDPYETPNVTRQNPPLATLQEKPKSDRSQKVPVKVGVVRLQDEDVFIIVVHRDGKAELVPLTQDPV